MNEVGWMFNGGNPLDFDVKIGQVEIEKRTPARVVLIKSRPQSGYRTHVPPDEVYKDEDTCRAAAAERVESTRIFFENKIKHMLEGLKK